MVIRRNGPFDDMALDDMVLEEMPCSQTSCKGLVEPACADPGIFVRRGPGQSDKKSSDNVFFFLVLSLFYRRQMANFKEIYHFSRFQGSRGGPTFSRGGSKCLFPIESHITCVFQFGGGGGSGPLSPPSGSALGLHKHAIFSEPLLPAHTK